MARALRPRRPRDAGQRLTVIAAMLVLLLADAGLDPLARARSRAIGVALRAARGADPAARAAHDLRPRAASGRGSRTVAYDPDVDVAPRRGIWRRVGDRVLRAARARARGRPSRSSASSRSGSSPTRRTTRSTASSRSRPRASRASTRSAARFPAGALAPTIDARRSARRPARRRRRRARCARGSQASRASRRSTPPAALEGRRRSARSTSTFTRRPVLRRRARRASTRSAPRSTDLPRRASRAGRRRQRGAGGLQQGRRARPQGDRPAGAARDRAHPRRSCCEAIVAPLVLIATVDGLVLRHARASRSSSSHVVGRPRASTPRCRPSPSSSSSRSGSTTRSS